jgi:hypothetical protein
VKRIFCGVLVLWLFLSGVALGEDTIPLGIYIAGDPAGIFVPDASIMRDSLGLNFVYGKMTGTQVGDLLSSDLKTIEWTTGPENRYSSASYVLVGAGDDSSSIKFEGKQGMYSEEGYLYWPFQDTMLNDLHFSQYTRNAQLYVGYPLPNPTPLHPKIKMSIDTLGLYDTSGVRCDTCLLGRILVFTWFDSVTTHEWRIRRSIDIRPDDSLRTGGMTEEPLGDSIFTLVDQNDNAGTATVKYAFWNSGKTTVYLDYFKCYDQVGKNLVESNFYADSIGAAVKGSWHDDVSGWWLRDEPRYDMYRPWGKVRQVVNDSTGSDKSIGAFLFGSVYNIWDSTSRAHEIEAFEKLTLQNKIVINDYPFGGGFGTGLFVDYAGYNDDVSDDGNNYNDHRGLQKMLELVSLLHLRVIRGEIARPGSPLTEFWLSPQWFYSDCGEGGDVPPATRFTWRLPTRSELRLQIGLGLCYGAKGINIWRYDFGRTDIVNGSKCWQQSFYDSLGVRDTLFWNLLGHEIAPFIKAVGSVYMGLTWQRAYPIHPENPTFSPAGDAFISSITAISNSPDSNPDLGWFHVGEFSDNSGDAYIMLVNRACSQGHYDSAEAPAITATVKLNPATLNLGNNVYIIDLARNVKHTQKDGWVGVPETAKLSMKSDGTFHYTTTLKAGEGRLYKITRVSSR